MHVGRLRGSGAVETQLVQLSSLISQELQRGLHSENIKKKIYIYIYIREIFGSRVIYKFIIVIRVKTFFFITRAGLIIIQKEWIRASASGRIIVFWSCIFTNYAIPGLYFAAICTVFVAF